MTLGDSEALRACTALISLALLLQTIEFAMLLPSISDTGIWRWDILRKDFDFLPGPGLAILDLLLGATEFAWVLIARGALASTALALSLSSTGVPFLILAGLLASSTLVLFRWRGTFNGGSDFMTLIVLTSVCASAVAPSSPKLREGALAYIALQVCASYFISGIIKLTKKNWRSGRTIPGFLAVSIYYPPKSLERSLARPWIALLASWSVLLFEVSFPLALFNTKLCAIYIVVAFAFHLGVFYMFGLNRFVFAWMAAYPALYYFCQRTHP